MEEARRWTDRAIRRQIDLSNLTVERERLLLRIVHGNGNERVKQTALIELWESHSKLVVAIASRYRHLNIDLLDLVGAGHLGLHAAIGRFDADHFESRLSTYAVGWIRWFIQDYVRRNSGPVRLPVPTPTANSCRCVGACSPRPAKVASGSGWNRPRPSCANASVAASVFQATRSPAACA